MTPDIDAVARLIREVAEAEILPRFKRLADEESWEKRPGSIVTVADEAAEEALSHGLSGILPGAPVVGEEACEADPSVLEHLAGERTVWIVDPIDGTANFAAGSPSFAVMIALVRDTSTVAGWIYDAVGGAMTVAEHGGGAYREGRRLAVAEPVPDAEMTGALGARLRRNPAFVGRFARVTRNRCCGLDYQWLATGASHFAFYRSLKPWDHAPGELIHREAGGHNACLDGRPYAPGRKAQDGLLMATDPDTWARLAADISAVLAEPA